MDPIGAVVGAIQDFVRFLQHTPGGFGVMLIPLGALALASIWAMRK